VWASACVSTLHALAVLALFALLGGCGGDAPTTGADGAGGSVSSGPVAAPSPSGEAPEGATTIATFAAGCFWGVEARFAAIPGVVDAVVGYTGGTTADPTYEDVCSGTTGHAEAVRLQYDPDVVSYEQLVEAFFAMHDPTTEDRQGPDVGSQYRSVIFFHTPQQEATARTVALRLAQSGAYDDPIVTEIVPAGAFWRAEEYHQDYYGPQDVEACPT
jgi:peptide-methionine (S)-S-oxide reductase